MILSNNRNAFIIYNYFLNRGEKVNLHSEKITIEQLQNMAPSHIISYNYMFKIEENIINKLHDKLFNLHISYLPWNRGSDPNFWSFVDNTPKGVTIHRIDKNLDTGEIILQKKIYFDETQETFASSYEKLNKAVVKLFCDNWRILKLENLTGKTQQAEGSYHKKKDLINFMQGEKIDWNDNIHNFKCRRGMVK